MGGRLTQAGPGIVGVGVGALRAAFPLDPIGRLQGEEKLLGVG